MLIVEGESLAGGMLFQGQREWDPWGRWRGHLGGRCHILHGLVAFLCCPCAVPALLGVFVTVPCSVCPQSPPRSGAGRGAPCPAASQRRTPAWSPRPPRLSGSRSVSALPSSALGSWGAAKGGKEPVQSERRSAACEIGCL